MNTILLAVAIAFSAAGPYDNGAPFLYFRNFSHVSIKVSVAGYGSCTAPGATGWGTPAFAPGSCMVHGLPLSGRVGVTNNLGEKTQADIQRQMRAPEDEPPTALCTEDRKGLTCL